MISLREHQKAVIPYLTSGSILCGGVGSGKSITALSYFYMLECDGNPGIDETEITEMKRPKDLYIITTARKRDTLEWDRECSNFILSKDNRTDSVSNILLKIDSWNNIGKYINIKSAFFIFDEQRLIGSGSWVKAFYKIAKANRWIILTVTPGDTWLDYIPVFVANGFYKNRSEFIREHVVFNSYTKYPKVDRYVNVGKLNRLKERVTVSMNYTTEATRIKKDVLVPYDCEKYNEVLKKRWNPFTNSPIKNAAEFCSVLLHIVTSDKSRIEVVKDLLNKHERAIIFYNYNYELELLRELKILNISVAEYNGHKHENIPKEKKWIYLVQYNSAEGWNCVETDTIIFYSQNYSYRAMVQAAGRIDRLNTPFRILYYYHIRSHASIDEAIKTAIRNKKNFNESSFTS